MTTPRSLLALLVPVFAALAACSSPATPDPTGSTAKALVDPCTHKVIGYEDKATGRVTLVNGATVEADQISRTKLDKPISAQSLCTGVGTAALHPTANANMSCYSWHDYEETADGYVESVGTVCDLGGGVYSVSAGTYSCHGAGC
jgi:hypothetical protein